MKVKAGAPVKTFWREARDTYRVLLKLKQVHQIIIKVKAGAPVITFLAGSQRHASRWHFID